MSVPGFQSWFLPLLKRLADGEMHGISELYEQLANDLGLSGDDRAILLKSGKQYVHENRIGWARTYLKKAGLLDSPSRGMMRITERGREVLSQRPEKVTVRFLRQFPEFVEFHTHIPKESDGGGQAQDHDSASETPQEALERIERELRDALSEELLDRIKKSPPSFFERLVVDLLMRMGYGGSREDAGRTIGKAGDGGIDGVINEDRLGLDVVYIQAKRWENPVGRPVVQAFAGSLEGGSHEEGRIDHNFWLHI